VRGALIRECLEEGVFRRGKINEKRILVEDAEFVCQVDGTHHHSFWRITKWRCIKPNPLKHYKEDTDIGDPEWISKRMILCGDVPMNPPHLRALFMALRIDLKERKNKRYAAAYAAMIAKI